MTCSEAKGSISIIEEESVKSNLFLWDFSTQKVEVTIPANRVLDLVIETDTGDVKFTGNASVNSLSIETDTGDINTKNSNLTVLTNANFEVDTGDIRLVKINAASISIESDTGDIYLGDCTVTNNVKIDVDTGDVTLCGVLVCETLGITTDTGEVDADEATVDANILSIETDTGDIDMKLSGKKADYEISVRHRTGDSNISNQLGSPRKLTVIAVTGDIEITFEN